MKKYQVIVEVDEAELRSSLETDDVEFNIIDAIEREMGWVQDSGIYIAEVKELKEDGTEEELR